MLWMPTKARIQSTKMDAIEEYPGQPFTCVSVVAILIQWYANKWRGILQFSPKLKAYHLSHTKSVQILIYRNVHAYR